MFQCSSVYCGGSPRNFINISGSQYTRLKSASHCYPSMHEITDKQGFLAIFTVNCRCSCCPPIATIEASDFALRFVCMVLRSLLGCRHSRMAKAGPGKTAIVIPAGRSNGVGPLLTCRTLEP